MYNINNNNPYGEWTVIPTLNENASPIQVNEYNQMFDKYCTEEVTEKEINEYFERLFSNNNVLNEYQERAWWGVSPFEWTKGLKGFNIFKPLKWLAMPLLGGIVLLLAGLYKLLKEGKKQIAIARVRAWIEKLVVLADSGYKKTRNSKDSLFLIRQRYRRDILQSAVKVATSLGIPVEEKNTKPESVETSLNESSQYYDPKKAIIITNIEKPSTRKNDKGNITFKKGNIVILYAYLKEDDHLSISKFYVTYGENEGYTYSLIPRNLSTSETITQDVIDVVKEIDNDIEEINKNNNWYDNKILNGEIIDLVPKDEDGIQNFTKPWELSENGINVGDKRSLESNDDQTQDIGNDDTQSLNREGDTQDLNNNDTQDLNNNDTQDLNKKSEETQDLSGEKTQPLGDDTQGQGEKGEGKKEQGEDSHTAVLDGDTMLPDDSRVDWSLMNTIKASQWFGLRHKSTNFWKEAKSVGMILGNENQTKDPVRNCALIISSTSNSLSLVASPGIAQQYASILQKYVQTLTNIDIQDTRNSDNYGTNRQDNRFRPIAINASENIDYDRQNKLYEMFKDDIKIFEDNVPTQDLMSVKALYDSLPEITQRQFIQSGLKLEDVNKSTLQIFNMLCQFGQNLNNIKYRDENGKLNINPDQIDAYLTVALSKALSTTNFNEWQMHRNAYDQMIKFINELTKSVHTIIDSVAKKAESITANGGAADTLISRFLSSKGDPKQNRSLHNLWDNIGVSKLQQRTIVHCEEIMTSPEMQYYLDMFLLTIPAVIKKQLGKGEFTASAKYKQNVENTTNVENNDANKAAADAVNNIDPKNNDENKNSLENFDPKRFTANKNYNGEEFLFAPGELNKNLDSSKKLVYINPVNEKDDNVFYLKGKYDESNNQISYILNAEKILINHTNLHYMSRLYKIQGHDKIEKGKFYIEHKNNIDGVVDAYSEKMRDDKEVSNDYIDITNLDNDSLPIIYICDDDYREINEKEENNKKDYNISLELIKIIDNNSEGSKQEKPEENTNNQDNENVVKKQESNDNKSIDNIKDDDLKNRATEALDGLSGLQYNRKDCEKLILEVISKYPNLSKEEIIKAALNWDRNTHDYKDSYKNKK